MLAVFYQTLDENKPKWQLDNGLIGSNPGLGFRPMPPESNVESTLVWFEASKDENIEYWISAIDEFLDGNLRLFEITDYCANCLIFFLVYKKADEDNKPHSNRVDCTPDSPPKDGKVCRVDVSSAKFGACTKSNQYGYSKGSPCVFLKLNKVCHVLSFGTFFSF